MNAGSTSNVRIVSCQSSANMIVSVTAMPMMFDSTVPSVLVTACCAPMTSELSRVCSAPVCVRVKNASGIRCTWSNSWTRRS